MITPAQAIESAFQAFEQGDADRAEWMANQALQQAPNDPALLNLLGSLYYQRGELREALVHYLAATEVDPENAQAFNNLGATFTALARFPEAIAALQTAITLDPTDAMAHFNLGNALRAYDHPEAAQAAYEEALRLNPHHAPSYTNLAHLTQALGDSETALRHFRQAMQLDPQNATTHLNLANALQEKGNLEAAKLQYEKAAQLQPWNPLIPFNLGQLHQALGDRTTAQTYYHLTLQLDSRHAAAHDRLGLLLGSQGQFQRAIAHLQQAIAFQPDCATTYHHLGILWRETKAYEGAIACFRHSLQLDPDFAEAHWDLAQTYWAIGQWPAGFAEAEWRWQAPSYLATQIPRHRKIARWDGKTSLRGKTLVLWTEHIPFLPFLRYLPLLVQGLEAHLVKVSGSGKPGSGKSGSAKQDIKILLECDPGWVKLLEASPAIAPYVSQVIPKDSKLPPCDVQAPIASLPFLLQSDRLPPWGAPLVALTAPGSHLPTPSDRSLHPPDRLGLIWSPRQGTHDFNRDGKNTIPLTELLPALSSGHWLSLQPGLTEAERDLLTQAGIDILPETQDWMDWATAIAPLSAVLTVDCELAHLAASLGKSVWLMLPFSAQGLWGSERVASQRAEGKTDASGADANAWYPNVRYLRQAEAGDWSAVIEAIPTCCSDRS
jgi:tetratricopeptide (TPR) repeat protein